MNNRIKELRQSRGITQSVLAKYLGVAQNTLSYWEQGKYDVDNLSLQRIANYFGVSIDALFGRELGGLDMFWGKFVRICNERGISPTAVVEALHISRGSITKWKNGSKPNDTTILKLADYFEVSPGYFSETKTAINSVNINKIKSLAKDQGIKIKYICGQLSLAEGYLSNVQSGKTVMTEERLEKIADILHTTSEYLRDETEVKEKASTDSEDVSVNTVIMRSRDGSVIKRRLSDEQVRTLQTIIGQLPDAPDDL